MTDQRLVDVFDLRQQKNVFALAGLGCAGLGTWFVRSSLLAAIRYDVEATTSPGPSGVLMSLPPPFDLGGLVASGLYWLFYAGALTALASRVQSERGWVLGFAVADAAWLTLVNGVRNRGLPAPAELLIGAVGAIIGMVVMIGLFRLTRRAGLALVLGLPAGTLLEWLWGDLARTALWWGQGASVSFGLESAALGLYFRLQGCLATFVPGLLFAAGLRIDERQRAAVAGSGRTEALPRRLVVGGLLALGAAAVGLTALAFGLLASPTPARAPIVFFLAFPLLVANAALCAFLVHRMWSAVPTAQARTRPGWAVGLLFVPLFNLYWLFQAIAGFATDWNRSRPAGDARRLPSAPFVLLPALSVLTAVTLFALGPALEEWRDHSGLLLSFSLWLGLSTAFLTVVVASLACDAVNGALPAAGAAATPATRAQPQTATPVGPAPAQVTPLVRTCGSCGKAVRPFSAPSGAWSGTAAAFAALPQIEPDHAFVCEGCDAAICPVCAGQRASQLGRREFVCPRCGQSPLRTIYR